MGLPMAVVGSHQGSVVLLLLVSSCLWRAAPAVLRHGWPSIQVLFSALLFPHSAEFIQASAPSPSSSRPPGCRGTLSSQSEAWDLGADTSLVFSSLNLPCCLFVLGVIWPSSKAQCSAHSAGCMDSLLLHSQTLLALPLNVLCICHFRFLSACSVEGTPTYSLLSILSLELIIILNT